MPEVRRSSLMRKFVRVMLHPDVDRDKRYRDLCKLITRGLDLNGRHTAYGRYGEMRDETVLMFAIRAAKDVRLVEMLIDAGADPHWHSEESGNLLHLALWGNVDAIRLQIIGLLLQRGVNPDFKRAVFPRDTPLHKAATFGRTKVVDLMLAAGADTELKDDDQQTVFNLMAEKLARAYLAVSSSESSGEFLLRLGSREDLDDSDDEYSCCRTALSDESVKKIQTYKAILLLLKQYGADALSKDGHGMSALDYANDSGSQECIDYMTQLMAVATTMGDGKQVPQVRTAGNAVVDHVSGGGAGAGAGVVSEAQLSYAAAGVGLYAVRAQRKIDAICDAKVVTKAP